MVAPRTEVHALGNIQFPGQVQAQMPSLTWSLLGVTGLTQASLPGAGPPL